MLNLTRAFSYLLKDTKFILRSQTVEKDGSVTNTEQTVNIPCYLQIQNNNLNNNIISSNDRVVDSEYSVYINPTHAYANSVKENDSLEWIKYRYTITSIKDRTEGGFIKLIAKRNGKIS